MHCANVATAIKGYTRSYKRSVAYRPLRGGCFPKKWPLPPSAPTTVFNLVSNIMHTARLRDLHQFSMHLLA